MPSPYERLLEAELELNQIKKRTRFLELTLNELAPSLRPEKKEQPVSIPPTPPALPPQAPSVVPAPPKAIPQKTTKATKTTKAAIDPDAIELRMGQVWFVRLGIILVLTGLVFLGNYAYQNYIVHFGAGSRLMAMYLGAIALTLTGIFCERSRESLRAYGRTLASGGLAAIYYATFAAHNVTALKVIDSPIMGAFLLGISALLFVGYAHWKQSPRIMSTALGLAFYSTAIHPIGWMACLSALVLSSVGILTFIKNRWASAGFVSLIASYVSFAWWQLLVGSPSESTHWFLPAYWLLFSVGTFGNAFIDRSNQHSLFLGLNNGLCFALFSLSLILTKQQESIWILAASLGALVLGLSFFKEKEVRKALLAQGVGILTLALILKLSGYQLFLTLLVESLMLLGIARRRQQRLFEVFSLIAAVLSASFTVIALGEPTEIPFMAWIIAPLLWITLGAFSKKDHTQLITFPGCCTTLMTIVILINGTFSEFSIHELALSAMILGVVATVASRFQKSRLIGTELWFALQGAAAFGIYGLFEGRPYLPLIALLALTLLLCNWLLSEHHLSDIEKDGVDFLQWFYLVFTTGCLGLLIHDWISSPLLRASLYSFIPVGTTVLGQKLKEIKLQYVPSLLYFGLLPHLFSGSSLELFIPILGLGLHFLISHASKSLRTITFMLFYCFWATWILETFPSPFDLTLLSLSGVALLASQSLLKIPWSRQFAYGYWALAIALSWRTQANEWSTYLCLTPPLLWALGLSYLGRAKSMPWLAPVLLSLLCLRISGHTLSAYGNGLAVAWAILGTLTLLIGLLVKSRAIRITALAFLLMSLAHVGLVDVWKLDPLPRILSLMSLGGGMLGLGFVYNRWHERLKHWLA